MRYLINSFLKYRDPIALAFYFSAVPIVYYLRDGLGLLPASPLSALLIIFGPLALTLPFKNLRYFESPNRVTFWVLMLFILYQFAYFYLKDRYLFTVSFYPELFQYVIIFGVAIIALFLRKESINHTFMYWVMILSFISAVALIFYVLQNPLYVIGQRAAFGYGGDVGVGNPHINSKGAYFGIIAAVLAIKYESKLKSGFIFPLALIVVNLGVLLLTQTMLAILATFLFLAFFMVFNFSASGFLTLSRNLLSKWYILLIIVASISTLVYQFNKNRAFLDPAINYFESRGQRIVESIFETKEEKNIIVEAGGDESANMRVFLISDAVERLRDAFDDGDYHYILFGQGYKFRYLDVPQLEMLDSFGVVGFVFFTILFLRMIAMCIREMRSPEGIGQEFLAYVFIYFLIANFTSGQMLDYTRMTAFIMICRFLKK